MPAGLLLASQLSRAASPASFDAADIARPVNAAAAAAQAANMAVYLEVSLNQTAYGAPQPFELRDGRLYASVATLRAIGFALNDRDSGDTLAPDTLPGVSVRFDATQQRVAIDAPLALLDLRVSRLNAPGADVPKASASPGLLLNYDLYASRDDRSDNATAFVEARAFGLGDGVFSQTGVIRHYREDGAPRRTDSIRLDTSWRWSRPESMFAVTVGDVVSASSTGPARCAWAACASAAISACSRIASLRRCRPWSAKSRCRRRWTCTSTACANTAAKSRPGRSS